MTSGQIYHKSLKISWLFLRRQFHQREFSVYLEYSVTTRGPESPQRTLSNGFFSRPTHTSSHWWSGLSLCRTIVMEVSDLKTLFTGGQACLYAAP